MMNLYPKLYDDIINGNLQEEMAVSPDEKLIDNIMSYYQKLISSLDQTIDKIF